MHRLVLLRHAKSDYPVGVGDHDRPLAARGRREAELAGAWLDGNVSAVDLVLVSSAMRTQQTWEIASAELTYQPLWRTEPRIYEASVNELLRVVSEVDDSVETLLLVGHNPGTEDCASWLVGRSRDDALERLEMKFPTSAIAILETDSPWSEFDRGCAELVSFVIPRG
jgi:phosphohistidine phosphatase